MLRGIERKYSNILKLFWNNVLPNVVENKFVVVVA